MSSRLDRPILVLSAILLAGCASEVREVSKAPPPPPPNPIHPVDHPGLKQRIAIVKFEDKSGYGNNLFGAVDDLGGQAADALAADLIQTGEFVVIERQQMASLDSEAKLQGQQPQFTSVTALAFGAVTEFGTKTEWQDQGLTKTKVQTAHAKVSIRLVDPATGVAFYSEFGQADATNETSQTLGFGSKAGYDATLTDRALNGAISKLTGNILNSLRGIPWHAPVLDVQPGVVALGAGKSSNVKVGTVVSLYKPGRKVLNKTTNTTIELPGTVVGKAKVTSLFGEGIAEGSMADILESSEPITTDMQARTEVSP